MGLRLKTAATISSAFLALIAATYLLFSVSLLKQFKELERERTSRQIERVSQALSAIEQDLAHRALDWGHWDESLEFIETRSPQYIESNLNYEALVPFEIKHVIFLDRQGQLAYGAELSLTDKELQPLRSATSQQVVSSPAISQFLTNPSSEAVSGLLRIDNALTFISIASITDSKATRPAAGFVIFTRELTPPLQSQLAKQTQLPLSFHLRDSHSPSFSQLSSVTSSAISESGDSITGIQAIRDLDKIVVATAEFSQPRNLLHQGEATRDSLMMAMAIFLVIANGLVVLVFDRTVLQPLAHFARRITTISKTNDLTLKVSIDRKDEIGHLSAVFNDLIDSLRYSYQRLHEATNAARDANDAKSRFIATVSHELRTPIHSVTGMLRILRQHESSDMKRSYLDMADSAACGLLHTINEILDFSAMESGKLSFELCDFDLWSVIQDVAQTIQLRSAPGSGAVDLVVDISPNVPRLVHGDPHRVSQILTNLLGNAFKFTHEGFVAVRVAASPTDTRGTCSVTFTIEDSGIGIPHQHLSQIFEPYNQGAISTPRLYQGSGLGLSIVKRLVEHMGGEITATSDEHRGSIFTVVLPFRCQEQTTHVPDTEQRVALLVSPTISSTVLARCLEQYVAALHLYNPDSASDLTKLLHSLEVYTQVIAWSPSLKNLNALRPIFQATNERGVPFSAVVNPEDLAIREKLSHWGLSRFPNKASGLYEILGACSEPPSTALTSVSKAAPSVSQPPLRVLIADDTPTNCIILQSLLEDAGHSVDVVTNGLDLLNRIKPVAVGDCSATPYDLVLTDLQMPLMDGNTAVQKFRSLERSSGRSEHLPVVAVTAHALPEELNSMRQAGMDDVVTKPINPSELHRVVAKFTQREHSQGRASERYSSVQRALSKIVRDVTPQSGAPEPLIELSDVFERSGQSMRRTRMILAAFLTASQAPLRELSQVGGSANLETVSRAAHTLKGLLLDVGARGTAKQAEAVERQCEAGQSSSLLNSELEALVGTIHSVAALISKILEKLPQAR